MQQKLNLNFFIYLRITTHFRQMLRTVCVPIAPTGTVIPRLLQEQLLPLYVFFQIIKHSWPQLLNTFKKLKITARVALIAILLQLSVEVYAFSCWWLKAAANFKLLNMCCSYEWTSEKHIHLLRKTEHIYYKHIMTYVRYLNSCFWSARLIFMDFGCWGRRYL
jgi:hypothetical protein